MILWQLIGGPLEEKETFLARRRPCSANAARLPRQWLGRLGCFWLSSQVTVFHLQLVLSFVMWTSDVTIEESNLVFLWPLKLISTLHFYVHVENKTFLYNKCQQFECGFFWVTCWSTPSYFISVLYNDGLSSRSVPVQQQMMFVRHHENHFKF